MVLPITGSRGRGALSHMCVSVCTWEVLHDICSQTCASICAPVHAWEGHRKVFGVPVHHFLPYFFETASILNIEQGWHLGSPSHPPVSMFHGAGIASLPVAVPGLLQMLASELSSSCSRRSTFLQWAQPSEVLKSPILDLYLRILWFSKSTGRMFESIFFKAPRWIWKTARF